MKKEMLRLRKINIKAQEGGFNWVIVGLIIAAIVLIILAVFGGGEITNLIRTMVGFGGGKVNVQNEINSCTIACTSQSVFDYCTKNRQVIFVEGTDPVIRTCLDLAKDPSIPGDTSFGFKSCVGLCA